MIDAQSKTQEDNVQVQPLWSEIQSMGIPSMDQRVLPQSSSPNQNDASSEMENTGLGDHMTNTHAHTVLTGLAEIVRLSAIAFKDLPIPSGMDLHEDGGMDAEWYYTTDHIVSISVGPSKTVYWASLFEHDSKHGTFPLTTSELPVDFLAEIDKYKALMEKTSA